MIYVDDQITLVLYRVCRVYPTWTSTFSVVNFLVDAMRVIAMYFLSSIIVKGIPFPSSFDCWLFLHINITIKIKIKILDLSTIVEFVP